jgi:glycosyltransferase involved in cell wall biosynthesis
MRILIVGPCPPPYGGVTRYIENHLSAWNGKELEIMILPLVVPTKPEPYKNVTLLNHNKNFLSWLRVITLGLKYLSRLGLIRLQAFKNLISFASTLRSVLKIGDIDVIYAHHSNAIGMVAVSEAKKAGVPCALVAYGECWLDTKTSKRKEKAINYSVSNADWVIATSEHCRNGALNRGASYERSSVVYAGIDLIKFNTNIDGLEFREKNSIPSDAIIISVLGLALRRKLDTLIEVIPDLLMTKNVYILIGGVGDDFDYLKQSVHMLKSDRVKLLGFVDEFDLPSFYRATDIMVVSPRTLVECMGQSMKEAMACGRVIVGPRLGGIPEAVENGKSGVFFETDDPKDMTKVIKKLIGDNELRNIMGTRGREIAEEKFDALESADKTYNILKNLVSNIKL